MEKKRRLKKGDEVKIISGAYKGEFGIIKKVLTKSNKIIVNSINIKVKHIKPSRISQTGNIKRFEFPIHISNVSLRKGVENS
uniref:Large ribosomal subunit protein uL24c n=1 Tax=Schizocladia ischiensis TaxID=196139 RepID=A0A7S6UA09_9STRA|nr:ribosomal protein L24 [Schizocladia ischiensis]QOW07545.1 ribosomal protein L24 [Schizocladia ischiensis]